MVGWIILLFDKISFYMSFEYFVILGWVEWVRWIRCFTVAYQIFKSVLTRDVNNDHGPDSGQSLGNIGLPSSAVYPIRRC